MALNLMIPSPGKLIRTGLSSLLVVVGSFTTGTAQVVFSASDLPSETGAYYRAYGNVAEVDVSNRIGPAGGPYAWDFSEPKAPTETLLRMDVVSPSDGGQGASFSGAAYAERTTRESDGSQSWSYHRIVPALGRSYFGFFDPVANPSKPVIVFDSPTIDLPARIEFGQSWTRTVEWEDLFDVGFTEIRVAVRFSSTAEVDAYGTLALPDIGKVPALRVNEVNSYEFEDRTLGLPLPSQHFRNYYWLVRGIGKAVHIVSDAQTSVPPPDISRAKTLLRVFEASEVEATPRAVTGLRVRFDNGRAVLGWEPDLNAAGYRVESVTHLGADGWQLIAEPTTTSWTQDAATTEPHQFFRVFTRP